MFLDFFTVSATTLRACRSINYSGHVSTERRKEGKKNGGLTFFCESPSSAKRRESRDGLVRAIMVEACLCMCVYYRK